MTAFTFAIVDRLSTFKAVEIVDFVGSRKKTLQVMSDVLRLLEAWRFFGVVKL